MLLRSTELLSHSIAAVDGEIGKIDNLLFDDYVWRILYLVVETGTWLNSRKVLLSPVVAREPERFQRVLRVDLTKARVEGSPDVATDLPVSRQLDADVWCIRYAIVTTLNWLPGRKVLIASECIERISWPEQTVVVRFPKDLIATSPEYNPDVSVDRILEEEVYRHYGIRGHWE